MKYTGEFANINDKVYKVTLENDFPTEDEDIIFGSSPVVINTESEGLFAPIKSRGATIEIVTKKYHFDLYSPQSREVSVLIQDDEDNTIFRGWLTPNAYSQDYTYLDNVQLEAVEALSTLKDFRWAPYWNNTTEYLLAAREAEEILGLTPSTPPPTGWHGSYTTVQGITYYILKGYANPGEIIEVKDYISFLDLILLLLSDCGYSGNLYVHNSYTRVNTKTLSELNANTVLDVLYAAPSNFYDDDAAHTPWTLYEVLEEVMKFLNMSLVPYGDDVYIIDYRYLAEKKGDMTFTVYSNILSSEHAISITDSTFYLNRDIATIEAPGTPSLSLEDIYNKIDISDNLYTLDKIAPDIFDADSHISITTELNLDENEWQWSKDNYKKFLWWKYDTSKEVTGYNYTTICRLDPKSGWVHHFYKHSTSIQSDTEIDNTGRYIYKDSERISLADKNYYNPDSTSLYTNMGINKYCNTHGALFEHYGYVKELGPNILPSNFDWTDIVAFFVADDTTYSVVDENNEKRIKFTDIPKLEKPVLEYTIDEEINYKPSSGTSWITISGDLFYQYNGAEYEISSGKKKREQVLTIINEDKKIYCTSPVDKAISELTDQKYCSYHRSYGETYYGTGFGLWKMSLQLGNKCWKDEWNPVTGKYESGWVDIEDVNEIPTFYIRYNNNPEDRGEEYIPAFSWMSVCSNVDYKDKVGKDCYAIPIRSDDANAPSFGRLYLTIYTPSLLPVEVREYFYQMTHNTTVSWKELPPVVFAKNFSLGYVYTDEDAWYKQKSDTTNPDRVYSGNINLGNVKTFNNLELKINTEHKSTPISRSYVATNNGYLHSLEHACTESVAGQDTNDQVQEYNKIDAYVIHHSDRKPIYEANVKGMILPYETFYYGRNNLLQPDGYTPYEFVLDSQSYDLLYNRTKIKMIVF